MEKIHIMKRWEIINRIIRSKGYEKYLEIGVRDGECFKEISCCEKTGVDPNPTSTHTTHIMPSDDFFASLGADKKFDIIFIDGLHIDWQVDKDIENSLNHLNEGGTIVLHDCNPPTEEHALEYPIFTPPVNGSWNGTVYKSLVKLRLYKNDCLLKTVDTDWGVGILTREESKTINVFPDEAVSWDFFDVNRKEIIGLITPEEFENLYKF